MVILSLFSMSFFGFFAIRPTLKTIAVLQKQIEDRSLVNEKLEQKINALIAAQVEYQRIEADIPLIYSLLPEKPDITSLIIKLEDLTAGKNVQLTSLTFDPLLIYGEDVAPSATSSATPASTDVLGTRTSLITTPVNFSFVFTGNYQDLRQLLLQLTRLNRIVTIETANLKVNQTNATSNATLTISLKSNTYYYPLPL